MKAAILGQVTLGLILTSQMAFANFTCQDQVTVLTNPAGLNDPLDNDELDAMAKGDKGLELPQGTQRPNQKLTPQQEMADRFLGVMSGRVDRSAQVRTIQGSGATRVEAAANLVMECARQIGSSHRNAMIARAQAGWGSVPKELADAISMASAERCILNASVMCGLDANEYEQFQQLILSRSGQGGSGRSAPPSVRPDGLQPNTRPAAPMPRPLDNNGGQGG